MKNKLNIEISSEQLADDRAKRIYHLRKTVLKLSRAAFGKKHDIPSGSLQNWEDVRYGGLTELGARKLIKAFNEEGIECDINWLLYGKGDEPVVHTWAGKVSVPGASKLSASLTGTPDDIALAEELKTFYKFHQNVVDTIISDNSLQPFYLKGYHVAGEKLFNNDINKAIGMDCIVQLQTGEILVRHLTKGTKSEHYTLICTNKQGDEAKYNIENTKLFSVAPIIWIRKPRIS